MSIDLDSMSPNTPLVANALSIAKVKLLKPANDRPFETARLHNNLYVRVLLYCPFDSQVRVLADELERLQYSNTSLRHWGIKLGGCSQLLRSTDV